MEFSARFSQSYRDYFVKSFDYYSDRLGRKIGSHFLTTEVQLLYRSVAFLNFRYSRVMNCMITIEHGIHDPRDHHLATGPLASFLAEMGKWGRRRGFDLHYIYVHENGRDHGLHTHAMAFVPVEHKEALLKWVTRAHGRLWARATIGEPIVVSFENRTTMNGQLLAQWRRFAYLCKGVHPDYGEPEETDDIPPFDTRFHRYHDLFAVQAKHRRPQGYVACRRRYGISKEIRDARFEIDGKQHQFRSNLDKGRFSELLGQEGLGGLWSYRNRVRMESVIRNLQI